MSIKNNKPSPKSRYKQGYFHPYHPEKYVGNLSEIIYRSSWERSFMIACDSDPSVIAWSSESVVVPYYSPIDQKLHKYYIDFVVRKKLKDGTIEEWLVEVKPSSQIPREDNKPKALEGKITLQKIKRNIKEKETYIINDAKFKAAHKYAEMTGRKFILLTEENF